MNNKLFDRFGMVASKLGNQIHLRTLRDAFATFMPFMILAGFVTLINYVILEPTGFMGKIVDPETLKTIQQIGGSIANGTLSIAALLIVVAVSYYMCVNRKFDHPIAAILVAVSVFIVLTPMTTTFLLEGTDVSQTIGGVIPTSYTSASGMFVGIFVGLLATETFIKLSQIEKLKIRLAGEIPPAVVNSFNVLIPILLTVTAFALVSFTVIQLTGKDVNTLISSIIITPLSKVTTGLPGFLLITSIANLFFGFGIHQAVISGALLDPFLLQNMQDNMTAFANNQPTPHIINMAFKDTFAVMGGSGNTIALLIAIFLFSKKRQYKDFAKLAVAPSIFNINEPIIFGLPIVFNISLIIPFILAPIFSLTVAYFATDLGFMNRVVVQIPWTTPPVLSAFLATAGDWRAAIIQILIIACSVFIYLPFLRVDERVTENLAKKEA